MGKGCQRKGREGERRGKAQTDTPHLPHLPHLPTSFKHLPNPPPLHRPMHMLNPIPSPVTAICHQIPNPIPSSLIHQPSSALDRQPSSHVCYPAVADVYVPAKVYIASHDISSEEEGGGRRDPSPKVDNLACPGWNHLSLAPVEMEAFIPKTVLKRDRRDLKRRGEAEAIDWCAKKG